MSCHAASGMMHTRLHGITSQNTAILNIQLLFQLHNTCTHYTHSVTFLFSKITYTHTHMHMCTHTQSSVDFFVSYNPDLFPAQITITQCTRKQSLCKRNTVSLFHKISICELCRNKLCEKILYKCFL